MKSIFTRYTFLWLFCLGLISQPAQAQNSLLVNFGSNTCAGASGAPAFSLIKNPLGGAPTVLTSCDLASQLPDFFSVFIAYNPKNNRIYVADVRNFTSTKIWVLNMGLPGNISCPATIPVLPDYTYSYVSNNFEFDNNGDLWSFSNYNSTTGLCNMDKFDVNTGAVINTRTLQFPTGNFPTAISSGDLTILPNGRMFATLGSFPSRLYEILNYNSTTTNATAVYLTTLPQSCYGIAYLNGQLELTGADFASSCYYYDYDISTNTLGSVKTFQNGQLPIDNASITPQLGVTKQIINSNRVNANTADITYEIYVRNLGNVTLNNINVSDNLASAFGAANVSNVAASFVAGSNTANLTLNPAFNGTTNTNLLNAGQNLPNQTATNTDYFFKVRISCRATNLNPGTTYLNSAKGSANIGSSVNGSQIDVNDVSNNGPQSVIDPNNNGNPSETGENEPTPFVLSTVPVRFLQVTATLTGSNSSLVKWQVATPTVNAEKFEVEYSTNGRTWNGLGQLAVNNANRSDYQWPHLNVPAGLVYYRIKQIDNDGSFIYSRVVVINNSKSDQTFTLYPNPANQQIGVIIPASIKGTVAASLFDATGRLLLKNILTGNNAELPVAHLPNGNYVLKLENNGNVTTQKLIILHP